MTTANTATVQLCPRDIDDLVDGRATDRLRAAGLIGFDGSRSTHGEVVAGTRAARVLDVRLRVDNRHGSHLVTVDATAETALVTMVDEDGGGGSGGTGESGAQDYYVVPTGMVPLLFAEWVRLRPRGRTGSAVLTRELIVAGLTAGDRPLLEAVWALAWRRVDGVGHDGEHRFVQGDFCARLTPAGDDAWTATPASTLDMWTALHDPFVGLPRRVPDAADDAGRTGGEVE